MLYVTILHHHADAVKGGELSYMTLAMEREPTTYRSLLRLADAAIVHICTVFTPGWCMLFGDYSDLWHAVGPGTGFRISITLFDHEVCSTGVRPQDGYVIDWSMVEDPRQGAEKYEPDIDGLVWYAHEYSRMCRKND